MLRLADADRLSEVLRADRGSVGLAPAFRERLEDGLGTSLAGAALQVSDLPRGTLALNAARGIVLDRAFLAGARADAVALVVAHEAVHAAQRLAPGSGRVDPEWDAAEGAVAILAGRRHRVRARLAPGAIAAWGEDGHYYTCYVVGLMAGVRPETARLRALFCQMPDEVHEFDATSAYHDMFTTVPTDRDDMRYNPAAIHRYAVPTSMGVRTIEVEETDSVLRRKSHDLAVQAGLHCLTGDPITDDRDRRRNAFDTIGKDDHLTYGLALHAFGDSFAHANRATGRMPPPGRGHLREGHEPDFIGSAPGLYTEYVGELYDLFRRDASSKPVPREHVLADFRRCAQQSGIPDALETYGIGPLSGFEERKTGRGCELIRRIAVAHKYPLSSYRPENTPATTWREFWMSHSDTFMACRPNATAREIYADIARQALRWAPSRLRQFRRNLVEAF